ncbi:hypothetical protein [Pedobacter terrae]|uniref:hypothetical protein n=1 Tax=Pedobacter terrae TaxID=405671 RepID=UPI002FF98EA0
MNEKNIMIKSWLLEVIDDGSWEKYNDLHIDQIDNAFEKKAPRTRSRSFSNKKQIER